MHSLYTPPMINGVCASTLYLPKHTPPPSSLFDFLCQKFAHISPKQWQQRFKQGQILSSTGKVLDQSTPYQHGTFIYYYRFVENESCIPFTYELLFENDDLMVVDKPHFLPVTPAGSYVQHTLLTRLKSATKNPQLSPIHRLDKDTAGLMLFSKNAKTRHLYQALFEKQNIHKVYHAIAQTTHQHQIPKTISLHLERGTPFYVMQVNPNKPANSHTHIKLLTQNGDWAKYELTPITGKLHQLRAHLNHLGIPIKNDPYYPTITHQARDDFSKPLQLLAKSLSFCDPVTKRDFSFTSSKELTL